MSDFEDDIFVKMEPVQTYSLTAISSEELARLRRIEGAARAENEALAQSAAKNWPSLIVVWDALRAALEKA